MKEQSDNDLDDGVFESQFPKEKIVDISKQRRKKKKKKRHNFRFLLWLLMVVVVLGGVLYIIIDMAVIRNIIVTGNNHYTRDEIIEMLNYEDDANIVDIYFDKKKDYSQYPYIRSVEVLYEGLNVIRVVVVEKDVISYIKYQNSYLAIDKDGYIIDYLDEIEGDVPLVEGLYFESAVVGQVLEVDESVINTLLDLHHLRQKYDVPLTIIDFPYSDSSMLFVYVNNIKIILGEAIDLDTKMKNAGEVIKKISPDLSGTLDLQEDKEQFIFKKNTN